MKTLELTVSVSLDGATFEDKPCMLVYNSAEGRLALIAKDYSFFASGKAAEIIPFLADARGTIAPKTNHDVQKILDTAEKLFYRKKIEDLEAKVE